MKKYFILAAAALAFAACTSDELVPVEPQQTAEPGAVTFDAYTERGVSRAGKTGVMKIDQLKESGFGVFGFYTDNNDYEQSRTPNFFYNQLVEWDVTNSYWKYEPIKYWPNEYGTSAISDDNDRVTYFAYAPYVEVTPANGKVEKGGDNTADQWGITGMTRNSAAGDPLVKYIGSFEKEKSVDLLWGVCDETDWARVNDAVNQSINGGVKGLPWLNVERPLEAATQGAANQRVKFTFKHALSQFSVNVDARVDGMNNDNAIAAGSKVYVRQISFTGFAMKGALNLNNDTENKAKWLDYNGTADLESGEAVIVYDQLKDGKEGTNGAIAANEKTGGMNPNIISNAGNTTVGVTQTPQSVFANPIVMVIPTGEDMEVTIIYDVETEDANLSTFLSDGKTPGSSIENRITKTVKFGDNNLQNGYHYTLNLHLGMNSVKFDAAVSDWMEGYETETNLPLNAPTYEAKASAGITLASIDYQAQTLYFAVSGLQPGETVTATGVGLAGATKTATITVGSKSDFTATDNKANSNGEAFVKVANIPENQTVSVNAETGYINISGGTSLKEVHLQVAQTAHPLNMVMRGVEDVSTDQFMLTVECLKTIADGELTNTNVTCKVNGVAVAGTVSNAVDDINGSGKYGFTFTSTGSSALLKAGDVVELTYTSTEEGSPSETIQAHIGGISYAPSYTQTVTYQTTKTYPATLPTILGNVTGTPTFSVDGGSYVTVSSPNITTVEKGSGKHIVATYSEADDDLSTGWFYTANSCKAQYPIVVEEQGTSLSWNSAASNKTNQSITTDNTVVNIGAKVKGDLDETPAGMSVTYEIVEGGDKFKLADSSNPEVTVKTTLATSTTYKLKVKASAAAVTNKYLAPTEITYEILVTTQD